MASFPHLYPPGATFFITFRLNDSLPKNIIEELKREFEVAQKNIIISNKKDSWKEKELNSLRQRIFGKYEHQLDQHPYGACYMNDPKIALIIANRISSYNNQYYTINNFCIMPNHVHLLVNTSCQLIQNTLEIPENYVEVSRWMKLIKGGSAFSINTELKRKGKLWAESFDHFSRSEEETERISAYISNNPITAKLSKRFLLPPYIYSRF